MTATPRDGAPAAPQAAIDEVEAEIRRALTAGVLPNLRLVGFGEISPVIALDEEHLVLKRMTGFRTDTEVDAYRDLFGEYLDALRSVGVRPVDTSLAAPTGERRTVYVVQPLLDPDDLAPAILGRDDERALRVLDTIISTVSGVVGPRLGLDSQLSNWADVDGELTYIDLTTPMLRDESGRDRLDTRVLIRTLPAPLRAPIHRFMAADIMGAYHEPSTTLIDLVANLRKERLDRWVPIAIDRIEALAGITLTVDEVDRYYRSNARMWEVLQRLRRFDRAFRLRVLRRTYPYFLPARVDR